MKLSLRALSLLALPAAAACNLSVAPATKGSDTGSVSFSYSSGDCLFGCDIAPMMLGTSESVSADLHTAASGVTVNVDDPSVVAVSLQQVTCCTSSGNSSTCTGGPTTTSCPAGQDESLALSVQALRAGSTKLHVMQGTTEMDGIELDVAQPAQIALTCNQTSDAEVTVGGTCTVDWKIKDAEGNSLQASSGVQLSVGDLEVAGLVVPFEGPQGSEAANLGLLSSPQVQGIRVGQTQVVASAAGVTGQLGVTVTAK